MWHLNDSCPSPQYTRQYLIVRVLHYYSAQTKTDLRSSTIHTCAVESISSESIITRAAVVADCVVASGIIVAHV